MVVTSLKSLDSVKGIVILEKSGNRVAAQYFATNEATFKNHEAQVRFEKGCLQKIRQNSNPSGHPDIVEHENNIVLSTRLYGGAITMLIADESENEIMLADVMNGYEFFFKK